MLEQKELPSSLDDIYRLIRERIAPNLSELAQCRSTAELHARPVYTSLDRKSVV